MPLIRASHVRRLKLSDLLRDALAQRENLPLMTAPSALMKQSQEVGDQLIEWELL